MMITIANAANEAKMLTDIVNGPIWGVFVAAAVLAVLGGLLISGRGAFLIAGFIATEKEQKKTYNERRLCIVTGAALCVMALMCLITGIFYQILPASFIYVLVGIIAADMLVMFILQNTFCRG